MDYEKLYKESLDRARNIYGASESKDILSTLTTIFPELRQNEDEKIREALIDGLYDCMSDDLGWSDFGGVPIDDCISWLEKQNQDAEKKELKKIHVIDEGKAEMDYCFTKMMNGEKVISVWSEEDDLHLKDAIHAAYSPDCGGDELIEWLKSLKNRMKGE